ncbi:MAG: methyltransferase domain-containing protein [Chitinispirillaceae bacterium]|nr:methyltransferase domain-containing protein [Chitinispirillaceae bacterium]
MKSKNIFYKLICHSEEILSIILSSEYPADRIIDRYFRSHKYLGSHDRKFIVETVYGILRQFRKCQYIINQTKEKFKVDISNKEEIFFIIITYLMLYEESFESPLLELKEFLGTKKYLFEKIKNTISSLSFKKGISESLPLAINYSFPDWMIDCFISDYGETEVKKICESLNLPAPLNLRVNTLKATLEECSRALEEEEVKVERTKFSPIGLVVPKRINVFSLNTFKDGWFEVQDEGSQLIPLLIDPKPNIKLLDLCAGGGGKTLEFAAIMKNKGEIFATDINTYKLMALRKRARRAGAHNIRIIEMKTISDLWEKYKEFFDIVFIDAPCSGTGTIRRNPDIKWRVTEKTVEEVIEKQRNILTDSMPLVKKGGLLVYVTCSLLRKENENQVEKFLTLHPSFQLVDLQEKAKNILKLNCVNGYFKIMPSLQQTDGFFCAAMRKINCF